MNVRHLLPLISLAFAGCFSAVPEAQCLRDLDCDGGRCVDNACTSGIGGGTGGSSAGGGNGSGGGVASGGGIGTGGGIASGGGTGGGTTPIGGGFGGGSVGGGAGGGVATDGGLCNCRDGFGTCQAGDSPLACGSAGGRCQACGFGEQCVNGACATANCGPQTCTGCCTNNFCLTTSQQGGFACGANGTMCMRCPMGQTCTNGTCTTPPPCSAATCPTGCCQNNMCVTSQTRFACGVAGGMCQRCPMGQDCNFGVCLPPFGMDGGFMFDGGLPPFDGGFSFDAGVRDAGSTVPAGSACTTNQQCQPPQSAFCLQANIAGQNTGYAGGYCTANCGPNQPCAAGGVCITESFFGASQSTCRAGCTQVGQQGSCRQGYVCAPAPSATMSGFCRPRCDAMGALTGCPSNQMCNGTTGLCQ